MRQLFKKYFHREKVCLPKTLPAPASLHFLDETTRYPPFAVGFPAVPVAAMLEDQKELVGHIRATLRFDVQEFDNLVLPVIERYAAFVHLLPASETHHHRGVGGLFRHGLEVGRFAARSSEAYQVCVGDTPSAKRIKEPRWQLAAFLGGLLHDLGKAFHDVTVIDKSGAQVWNPQVGPLLDWAQDKGVERYFIRWRQNRKTRHKEFTSFGLSMVLTKDAAGFLNDPDPEIMTALLESVQGAGFSSSYELAKIVMDADQASIQFDMKANKDLPDENVLGVPIETYLFNALRRYVASHRVNEKGSMIWVVDKGVNGAFIAWKKIMPQINLILDENRVSGIPRSPDLLADILAERGYVLPYHETPESRPQRYWTIYPELLEGVFLECIKLDEPARLFQTEPPVPVAARLSAFAFEEKPSEEEAITVPGDTDLVNEEEVCSGQYDHAAWDYASEPDPPPEIPAKSAPRRQARADNTQAKLRINAKVPPVQSLPATKTQRNNSVAEPNTQETLDPALASGEGEGWQTLNRAIARSRKGYAVVESFSDGDYGIPYPSGAKYLGEPKEVMNLLSDCGLLKKDSLSTAKTATIMGRRYLALAPCLRKYIHHNLHASPGEMSTTPDGEFNRPYTGMEAFNMLAEQARNGFGPLIVGDVETIMIDGSRYFLVSIECLAQMRQALQLTEKALETAASRDSDGMIEYLHLQHKIKIRD